MIVFASYPADDILPLLRDKGVLKLFVAGKSYNLDTSSKRYQLFNISRRCVCCGSIGVEMRLEQHHKNDALPHFNLYDERGVLMTKDHITPRSRGGSNDLSNLQTMCALCNHRKGNRNLTIAELRVEIASNGGKFYHENLLCV